MKISTRIIWIWLLLFLPFLSFKLFRLYIENEKHEKQYSSSLDIYTGSKFALDHFVDSNGADTKIDLSKSDITVVDFWFKDCPPCLDDMKSYSKLIQGKEKQINVVTVCVNRFDIWKALLDSSDERFIMFSMPVSNWKHLVLKSTEDPKLKNEIPAKNLLLLDSSFHTTSFPMYFVLDKNGTIIAAPFSLSKYIELEILKRNSFLYFLKKSNTWSADLYFIPLAFVEYSGFFWIFTILTLSLVHALRKKYY